MTRKGICMICACTEADGCAEGCEWANIKQTLCTACANLSDAERQQKRAESMEDLAMRHSVAVDELLELKLRMQVLESRASSPKNRGGWRKRDRRQQPYYAKGVP